MWGLSKEERDMNSRIAVKRATRELDKQEFGLKQKREDFIRHAREARDHGDDRGFQAAREFVRMTFDLQNSIRNQKMMLAGMSLKNAEAKSLETYVTTVKAISNSISDSLRVVKTSKLGQQAMRDDELLSVHKDNIQASMEDVMSTSQVSSISDADLDKMINGADQASNLTELDELKDFRLQLSALRKSIPKDA